MGSENAKAVGFELSESIRNKKFIDKGDIIRKHGYAKSTSLKPKLVLDTKSCKEVTAPVLDQLLREQTRLLKEIGSRELTDEKYKDLTDCLEKNSKLVELLSGRPTERNKIDIDATKIKIQSLRDSCK